MSCPLRARSDSQRVPIRAMLVALVLAAATACTGAQDDDEEGAAAATTPGQPSSGSSATPVPIRCGGVIGGGEPGPEYKIVQDAVALPSTGRPALQAQPLAGGHANIDSDVIDSGWYWAKWGLVVRGATPVELAVPDELSNDMRIGWGQLIEPAASTVMDCDDTDRWIAFAGGYWVRDLGCYAVDVTVGTNPTQRVDIGIGAPCKGQDPPPEPNG